MKRERSSSSSASPLTRKVRKMPRDVHSVLLAKLPVHEQKVVEKEQYQLLKLKALIFRDFLRELVTVSTNTKFKLVYTNATADKHDIQKVVLYSADPPERTDLESDLDYSDPPGEYHLNVRRLSLSTVNYYASNMFELVAVVSTLSCTSNIATIVRNMAEKLYPNTNVKIIQYGGINVRRQRK